MSLRTFAVLILVVTLVLFVYNAWKIANGKFDVIEDGVPAVIWALVMERSLTRMDKLRKQKAATEAPITPS